MTSGSEFMTDHNKAQGLRQSAAADEIDDLDFVPRLDARRVVEMAFDHHGVVLDSDQAGIDLQFGKQCADGDGTGDLERLAVQTYGQSLPQVSQRARRVPDVAREPHFSKDAAQPRVAVSDEMRWQRHVRWWLRRCRVEDTAVVFEHP